MNQKTDVAVEVVLEGGPACAWPADVLGRAPLTGQDRLKIPFRGGYEHFERREGPTPSPVVFRWVARTMVAE